MRYVLVRVGPVLLLGGFLALVFGQPVSFEKAAKAVFEAKCVACHGAARMSDLDLRDRATILKGGKRGPAIVPGNAEASLLYKAVRREGDLQMPPGKIALTAAEVKSTARLDQRRRAVGISLPPRNRCRAVLVVLPKAGAAAPFRR